MERKSLKITQQLQNWEGFQKFNDNQFVDIIKNQTPISVQLVQTQDQFKRKPSYQKSICQPQTNIRKRIVSLQKERLIEITKELKSTLSQIKKNVKTESKVRKLSEALQIQKKDRIQIIPPPKQNYVRNGKPYYKGICAKNSYQLMKYFWNYQNRNLNASCTLKCQDYQFNSNFECGNLNEAIRVSANQFDLYIRPDTNTSGHRQWFYFSLKSKIKSRVRLNIYMFKKKYSLYLRGMKPYTKNIRTQSDWQSKCFNVYYRPIVLKQGSDEINAKGYYLSFDYDFDQDGDEVYFSAGIPYSYSYLQLSLSKYQQKAEIYSRVQFEKKILTKSLAGLEVPLVKIFPKETQKKAKTHIIINARTHPGETSSSWVVDGLINELINNQEIVEWINKENVWFSIVPMLNPDGVLVGNYRTGILGQDFNRNFLTGNSLHFPQINALRELVITNKRNGKIALFLDLHGHSILRNSFIYGSNSYKDTKLSHLPFLLETKSQYFALRSCRLKNQEIKTETARLYFQQNFNILSLTCQNSLGLYSQKIGYLENLQKQKSELRHSNYQMSCSHWKTFGSHIGEAIMELMAENSITIIKQLQTLEKQFYSANIKKSNEIKSSSIIQLFKQPIQQISNSNLGFAIKESNFYKKRFSCKKQDKYCQQLDIGQKKIKNLFKLRKKQPEHSIHLSFKPKNQYISSKVDQLEVQFEDLIRSKTQQSPEYNKYIQNFKNQENTHQIIKQIDQISQNYNQEDQINDTDSSSDDLPQIQKKQLMNKVSQLKVGQNYQEKDKKQKTEVNSLTTLKTFKQYIFKKNQTLLRKNYKEDINKSIPRKKRYNDNLTPQKKQIFLNKREILQKSFKISNKLSNNYEKSFNQDCSPQSSSNMKKYQDIIKIKEIFQR